MSEAPLDALRAAFRAAWPAGYRGAAEIYHRLVNLRSPKRTFRAIYRGNSWNGEQSLSGPGSDPDQTRVIGAEIPRLLRDLGARSILDIPCGDLHWIGSVDLGVESYRGGDIVPELIAENRRRFAATPFRSFDVLDATRDPLPTVDLILCRDCLVHLPLREAMAALDNFRRSGSTWLLTTTFPATKANKEVLRGEWRPLNLELPPFGLRPPERLLNEGCTEQEGLYPDKSLGLWRLGGQGG